MIMRNQNDGWCDPERDSKENILDVPESEASSAFSEAGIISDVNVAGVNDLTERVIDTDLPIVVTALWDLADKVLITCRKVDVILPDGAMDWR